MALMLLASLREIVCAFNDMQLAGRRDGTLLFIFLPPQWHLLAHIGRSRGECCNPTYSGCLR